MKCSRDHFKKIIAKNEMARLREKAESYKVFRLKILRESLKDLSASRSGAVFGEWDYNEGLKFGVF